MGYWTWWYNKNKKAITGFILMLGIALVGGFIFIGTMFMFLPAIALNIGILVFLALYLCKMSYDEYKKESKKPVKKKD